MAVLITADDQHMVDQLLSKLYITTVITPQRPRGSITPAAIHILKHIYHFLRYDGDRMRTPSEVSVMVIPASFASSIRNTSEEELPQKIESLLKYSLQVERQNATIKVVGVELVLKALEYALHQQYVSQCTGMLHWTIIDSTTSKTVLDLGHRQIDLEGVRDYLLEGIMVAQVMYPAITLRLAVDDVELMPLHDSEVQLVVEDGYNTGKYRITVPGAGFTNHYLSDVTYDNKIRKNNGGVETALPLSEGYIIFDSPDFLQGLLTMSKSVPVTTTTPWQMLETKVDDSWVPATIS